MQLYEMATLKKKDSGLPVNLYIDDSLSYKRGKHSNAGATFMDGFYNLEMSEGSVLQRFYKLYGDVHIHTFKQQFYDATLSEKQRIKALVAWSRDDGR